MAALGVKESPTFIAKDPVPGIEPASGRRA
jgi:hypothetical protein